MLEFNRQSEQEIEHGVNILEGMSFKSWQTAPPPLPQFQIGFITHVIVPLYITSASAGLTDMTVPLTHLRSNLARWTDTVAAEKAQKDAEAAAAGAAPAT